MNKKQIIILTVSVIIAFTVGFFVGDSTAVSKVNKRISTEVNNPESNTEAKPEPKKENGKQIKLKEQAAVADIGFKILDTKESTAISNKAGKSTPSGKFIVLKLELKNNGKQALEYDVHDFILKNKDTVYEVDDNAFEASGNLNSQEKIFNKNKNFIGVYEKFNSGITKNTYIVFDIPKENKLEDLKLIIKQDKNIEFNLK